jgi:carbon starvation protein
MKADRRKKFYIATHRRDAAMSSPFWFVLLALVCYFIAYRVYGKWYDRKVWKPDRNRTTPAHMYTDGVEYFPVSKYVLWGYQFKSVAALGPVLGPFIAIQFGWLPALLWIVIGNFFIGWLQDYGAIMVSVRNQGRSFGPISYEFTGAAGRNTLLGFILIYLLIVSAAFIFLISLFWKIFPGTPVATLGVFITGVVAGQLLYRAKMNIGLVTLIALAGLVLSLVAGSYLQIPASFTAALGDWSIPFWALVCCVVLYLGSVLPLPTFIQPINYVSFFPTFLAVVLILVGALVSPFTGIQIHQDAIKGWWAPNLGPIWPILFVAIACGAISGWHSLVSSSSTSKQLDVETDAHPIGAGAMLSEGLLALASLAAYVVVGNISTLTNVGAWVSGSISLTSPFLGGPAAAGFLTVFFGLSLILFAVTVQALVTRFWRLVSAEMAGEGAFRILGQKHVATVVGLLIPFAFAITGSWWNLWLYFGGANQLMAALALWLISIHLLRTRAPSLYTMIPAAFMTVTTLAAIGFEAYYFLNAVFTGKPLVSTTPGTPLSGATLSPAATQMALVFNGIFFVVGIALFVLGCRMAWLVLQSYLRSRPAAPPEAQAAPAD